jgi:predicted TPR repeat methyltransferase
VICRHCGADLTLPFVDLGSAPPSNAYLTEDSLRAPEKWFPLRALVCTKCWLVQTEDFTGAEELFNDEYAYFSSYSATWLSHAQDYVSKMIERFGLSPSSNVVEIAANDGYLLQFFQKNGIPCFGVEPTANTASAARQKGLEIIERFFGLELGQHVAAEGKQADLITANNVLAHVPDINDFVKGFAALLKPQGVATFEFPHLVRMVSGNQFDTIYHEHFSYLSFVAVKNILEKNGLVVFDVEELSTHGGSLRVFTQCRDTGQHVRTARVGALLEREKLDGVNSVDYYSNFQDCANKVKDDFLNFLINAKRRGAKVAAYGAAAKGNTLLNFAGVRQDLINFVVDRNTAKQGKYLPGSRIPIVSESQLKSLKPDFIVILPWNLKTEIIQQLDYIDSWGGKFITAVPNLVVT